MFPDTQLFSDTQFRAVIIRLWPLGAMIRISDVFSPRRRRPDGIQEFGRVLESYAGPKADPDKAAAIEAMREKGIEAYEKYFSFFRNPGGVATAMLFEAWVMQQQIGILKVRPTGP